MAKDPNQLFTKIFFALTSARSDVDSMRRISIAGLADAEWQLAQGNRSWLDDFLADSENDSVFIDKAKFLETSGGAGTIAERMAADEVEAFHGSIDAGSIVFMHSAVDAAAHDLCRVAHSIDCTPWYEDVSRQQVSLKDASEKGCDVLVKERTAAFVERLSRASMLEKIECLFRVCQPKAFQRKGYTYDRTYLEKIDRLLRTPLGK